MLFNKLIKFVFNLKITVNSLSKYFTIYKTLLDISGSKFKYIGKF